MLHLMLQQKCLLIFSFSFAFFHVSLYNLISFSDTPFLKVEVVADETFDYEN